MTFAEGCTVFQVSTSESLLISNGDTWMNERPPLPRYKQWQNLDAYIFQTYSPGGATIGSPICSGILTTARFLVVFVITAAFSPPAATTATLG